MRFLRYILITVLIGLFVIGVNTPRALITEAQTTSITLPLCSDAVHNSYTTVGPDGNTYKTWHPQIDYINMCYFNHEHGSDPETFKAGRVWADSPSMRAEWPAFGYTATRMGMNEGHAGFKVYVINDTDYVYQFTHHFGTGDAAAASCNRYHTTDLVVREQNGPIVANLHFMLDYGKAISNINHVDMTPSACPNQANVGDSSGLRFIPVLSEDPTGATGYEPWRADLKWLLGNVVNFGGITFNTYEPQTACNTYTCTAVTQRYESTTGITLPANGAIRFVTINNVSTNLGLTALRIRASSTISNTFYTDAHGLNVVNANDTGAVKQYIKPGLDITLASQQWWQNGQNSIYEKKNFAQNADWEIRRNRFILGAN